ncbi:hypothetical protein [Nocardia altamirensis]|uniref:hypothetical protein n=1 Tax=Nocardia altamirensis TaxID=472158 RepID=UPI00083FDB17|nr:hypothetical protein [Nocardia altamirensis]
MAKNTLEYPDGNPLIGGATSAGGAIVGRLIGGAFGPLGLVAGAAIGGAVGGAVGGFLNNESVGDILIDAGTGAVGGGLAAFGVGKMLMAGEGALMQGAGHTFVGASTGLAQLIRGVTPKDRRTIDIGNDSCPAMPRLQKPAGLGPELNELYDQLPPFLCRIWKLFGRADSCEQPPVAPAPAKLHVPEHHSGIKNYELIAKSMVETADDFAKRSKDLSDLVDKGEHNAELGRTRIRELISGVNKFSSTYSRSGTTADDARFLHILETAFANAEIVMNDTARNSERNAARIQAMCHPPVDPPPSGDLSPHPHPQPQPDLNAPGNGKHDDSQLV